MVMLLDADSGDMTWTRLTFVLGSVEAITFAAAGAQFGVSVRRERVKKPEVRADAHAREAACGRALAAFNLGDAAAGTSLPPVSHSAADAYRTQTSVGITER
jgi:hypothetical protein